MTDANTEAMQQRQLRRLETLIDSAYALVIVLLVATLPIPSDFEQEFPSLWSFLASQVDDLVAPLIGLALIITYWIQNNSLFGYLARTDNRHATLSIVQLLFVLLYLYSADLFDRFPDNRSVLGVQSAIFCVMGGLNILGWRYASGTARLLLPGTSDAQARKIGVSTLPEPITALVTLPFAFVGEDAWNLAWLAFPLVSYAVKRLGAPAAPDADSEA